MAGRVLALLFVLLPPIRSWGWFSEPHGSREIFRDASNASLHLDFNKTQLYTSGAIVGEVSHNQTANITTCRFTEVRDVTEREWLYRKFEHRPKEIEFDAMMTLIEKCGVTVLSTRRFPRFLNPVFPGTVWCGPGDSALDYETLGYLSEPDSCCRNHDLCPIRALPGETMTPKGPNKITISDCRCDHALKTCLEKAAKNDSSYVVGSLTLLMEMTFHWCFAADGNLTTPDFGELNFK